MLENFGANAPRPVLHKANAAQGDLTRTPAFHNRAVPDRKRRPTRAPASPARKDPVPAPSLAGTTAPSKPDAFQSPEAAVNFQMAQQATVEGKDDEAARLYRLAADQGHAAAQYNLARFYVNGRGGLPKDEREAARLYRLAADQGYAWAQYNLAAFYETGRGGLAKDEREAARLYGLSANQENNQAKRQLPGLGQ
ncbi:sel1 repeat family protein [Pseudoroseomonas oryzae]|uniref:Sel1 repeat family protein n=2 Tax=Teichococcus oryzae TaxID=1608942 RepID=A0A5B2TBL4_9PROT|nr:sel1 repeat family protein [Pseudoroseomonas oryzae]